MTGPVQRYAQGQIWRHADGRREVLEVRPHRWTGTTLVTYRVQLYGPTWTVTVDDFDTWRDQVGALLIHEPETLADVHRPI